MPQFHTMDLSGPPPPEGACAKCHGSGLISVEGWPAPVADTRPPYHKGEGPPFKRCPDCQPKRGPLPKKK